MLVTVLALTDRRGQWTVHTLELLGDAGKIARQLNARVEACVPDGSNGNGPPSPPLDFPRLARHGCQCVRVLRHPRLQQFSSETVAAALSRSVTSDCRILVLPGTAPGEEVAALAAVQLDSVWVPNALTMSATRSGVLEITSVEPGGKLSRTHRVALPQPVIVTIRPGVAERRCIETTTELAVLESDVDLADVPERTQIEKFLQADPRSIDIRYADRLVAAGRGSGGAAGIRLIEELARTMGAAVAASRMAVDLGWADAERQVGQTGKTVQPDLYVACGISGASHHLAGMRESRHIVAINSNPDAAIHAVSDLSLVGDLHEIIPAIQAVIKRRRGQSDAAESMNEEPAS